MSTTGLRQNSIMIYLRPLADQQPYQINNAARWLVYMGKFPTFMQAQKWLANAEDNHPLIFKTVMSQYYEATEYRSSHMKYRNVNSYQTDSNNIYGQEPHMFF